VTDTIGTDDNVLVLRTESMPLQISPNTPEDANEAEMPLATSPAMNDAEAVPLPVMICAEAKILIWRRSRLVSPVTGTLKIRLLIVIDAPKESDQKIVHVLPPSMEYWRLSPQAFPVPDGTTIVYPVDAGPIETVTTVAGFKTTDGNPEKMV
jgi:hypothetical protein